MEQMKDKLRKFAMLHIADLMEEYNDYAPANYEDPTQFMKYNEIEIIFKTVQEDSRIDCKVIVTIGGEMDAEFTINGAR